FIGTNGRLFAKRRRPKVASGQKTDPNSFTAKELGSRKKTTLWRTIRCSSGSVAVCKTRRRHAINSDVFVPVRFREIGYRSRVNSRDSYNRGLCKSASVIVCKIA